MDMNMEKARRELLRWLVLQALHAAQPVGTGEAIIKNAIESVILDVTVLEIRNALDYLAERELVTVSNRDTPNWFGKLTRYGIDIVEYTVECHPGIARPKKYW